MTYIEAIANGYTNGRVTYSRGYISRKIDKYEQPVKQSPKTKEYYVEWPAYNTTNYHLRQYLVNPRPMRAGQ